MTAPNSLSRQPGYIEREGERIYYESTGIGPPTVLCHGLGGNHAIWWRQVEPFSRDRRLITWDQRGFGNSTLHGGDVRPAKAADDLAAIVDRLGVDRIDLVGQSMGGWTALRFTLEHPDRVRALVLSTTLAGADRAHVDVLVNAEPDRDRFNRREHPVLSAPFCREHPDLGVLYNQISSFGARPDPATVLAAMAAEVFRDEQVAVLDIPVLILMAAADELCPPAAMKTVADLLPNARLAEIPGYHSAYYEQPDVWNSAVLEFLDGI